MKKVKKLKQEIKALRKEVKEQEAANEEWLKLYDSTDDARRAWKAVAESMAVKLVYSMFAAEKRAITIERMEYKEKHK